MEVKYLLEQRGEQASALPAPPPKPVIDLSTLNIRRSEGRGLLRAFALAPKYSSKELREAGLRNPYTKADFEKARKPWNHLDKYPKFFDQSLEMSRERRDAVHDVSLNDLYALVCHDGVGHTLRAWTADACDRRNTRIEILTGCGEPSLGPLPAFESFHRWKGALSFKTLEKRSCEKPFGIGSTNWCQP